MPYFDRRRWLAASLLATSCRTRFSSETAIPYAPHAETMLDVFRPRNAPSAPGVLTLHGGGWREGSREEIFRRVCVRFLNKGFVVANADYRLAPTHTAPAAVDDARAALAWFRSNAGRLGVNPSRILVMGESAGAHLAFLAASTQSVAGVACFSGVYDLMELLDGPHKLDSVGEWIPPGPRREALAQSLSPLALLSPGLPPVFLAHNEGDPLAPSSQARRMAQALTENGVSTRLEMISAGRHSFSEPALERVYAALFDWWASLR